MKVKTTLTLALLLSCLFCGGQNSIIDLNIEFQAYPAGIIPGLRVEKGFAGRHAVHLRLGYQLMNHRDWGVQEEEKGWGYGFSVGYKRYFRPGFKGPSLGLRSDLWRNTFDWKNGEGTPTFQQGRSTVMVVQPTLEAAWLLGLGSRFVLAPSIAFGYEVNVKTIGEPTGEGPIFLIGILFGRRLNE